MNYAVEWMPASIRTTYSPYCLSNISDKYAGTPFAPIIVPQGASFKDMVALKGKPDIGDQINKK